MNGKLTSRRVCRVGLLSVAGLVMIAGTAHAQDYYQRPLAPTGCANGSCGASARPGAATCPNGRCSSGPWIPSFGNVLLMPSGVRQYGNPSRPAYPAVASPPNSTPSVSQRLQSPYYTESDFQTFSTVRTTAPSHTATPQKNYESPYYE
jgi:hypothetical protein